MHKGYENRYQIEMISIEDLVPQEHLLRQISSTVNFELNRCMPNGMYGGVSGRLNSSYPIAYFRTSIGKYILKLKSEIS